MRSRYARRRRGRSGCPAQVHTLRGGVKHGHLLWFTGNIGWFEAWPSHRQRPRGQYAVRSIAKRLHHRQRLRDQYAKRSIAPWPSHWQRLRVQYVKRLIVSWPSHRQRPRGQRTKRSIAHGQAIGSVSAVSMPCGQLPMAKPLAAPARSACKSVDCPTNAPLAAAVQLIRQPGFTNRRLMRGKNS